MGKYLDMAERFFARRQAEQGATLASAAERVDWSALPADALIAVKVWSPVLDEAVWVVADDLPRGEWPTDAPVYTYTEVKILKAVGRGSLAWVHTTKAMFRARVVDGQPQSVSPLRGCVSASQSLANDGQDERDPPDLV